MAKEVDLFKFMQTYSREQSCKEFLFALIWNDGYACRKKCSNLVSVKGAIRYHRRCQRCKYDESRTAGTLFQKLKFPYHKAFASGYLLCTLKKGLSTTEITRQFGIHQETTWLFLNKR